MILRDIQCQLFIFNLFSPCYFLFYCIQPLIHKSSIKTIFKFTLLSTDCFNTNIKPAPAPPIYHRTSKIYLTVILIILIVLMLISIKHLNKFFINSDVICKIIVFSCKIYCHQLYQKPTMFVFGPTCNDRRKIAANE